MLCSLRISTKPHEVIQANRIQGFLKSLYGNEDMRSPLSGLHVPVSRTNISKGIYSVRLDNLVWKGKNLKTKIQPGGWVLRRARRHFSLERLAFYCQTTSSSMCYPTRCAGYCSLRQPLLGAFPGWILPIGYSRPKHSISWPHSTLLDDPGVFRPAAPFRSFKSFRF